MPNKLFSASELADISEFMSPADFEAASSFNFNNTSNGDGFSLGDYGDMFSGVAGLYGAYNGQQQVNLGRDQFNFSRQLGTSNFNNNVTSYNQQVGDQDLYAYNSFVNAGGNPNDYVSNVSYLDNLDGTSNNLGSTGAVGQLQNQANQGNPSDPFAFGPNTGANNPPVNGAPGGSLVSNTPAPNQDAGQLSFGSGGARPNGNKQSEISQFRRV